MTTTSPESATVTSPEPGDVAGDWIESFSEALHAQDVDAVVDHFLADGWYRDLLALTWDIRSFHGTHEIAGVFRDRLAGSGISGISIGDAMPPMLMPDPLGGEPFVQAALAYETEIVRGRGLVSLRRDANGDWKAFTVMLQVLEIKGHEETATSFENANDAEYTLAQPGRLRPREAREARLRYEHGEPDVVVIGAGHSGLTVAAHLKHLGVDTLVVDKHPRVGDNWRTRYENLILHDPSWIQHFPFLKFPKSWPMLVDKDKLGDWLASYANALDLNVWAGTEATSATYDEAAGRWSITLKGAQGERVLRPKHIVFATGLQAIPRRPILDGEDRFAGEIVHSATFTDGKNYTGQNVIVVGTGSSAHDIALDLYEQGAEVTMVQRSPSYVMSTNKAQPIMLSGSDAVPLDMIDLGMMGTPWPVGIERESANAKTISEVDRELLEGLEDIGFQLSFGGIPESTFNGVAYYIDQGCSQLLVDRKIGFARGSVSAFDERHLILEDGTRLEADAVVFATGFENMRESVRPVLGDDVTDQLDEVWGIDEKTHEIKGLHVNAGCPGIWYHSGALYMTRQYSGSLALQIKAVELGLRAPGPVRLTSEDVAR